MTASKIQVVDLSPFFCGGDEKAKNKAKEMIGNACCEYGFFQISNHGFPLDLMTRALKLEKMFFEYPDEEKIKAKPAHDAPMSAGYNNQPFNSADNYEFILMLSPELGFNVFPTDPPQLREVMEEMFLHFTKTSQMIETIVNELLGLDEHNQERSGDSMVALRCRPAANESRNAVSEHKDGNLFSLVIQDEAGGLEVRKDGEWIPVVPTQGTIVVNIGDAVQVSSNNKLKSGTHRVVSPVEKSRFSYEFFYKTSQ